MKKSFSPIVLMYHGIVSNSSLTPENRETGAELYDVTVEEFKSQMKWLKDQGYVVTSLDNVPLNVEKSVIITFDDGEMNNFQEAFLVLKEYGWRAYFFIIAKRVGERGYMGWNELRQLEQAGMIVGSHGLTHEILTNILDSQMEEELRASKSYLEINLNIPIHALSIPRGFCNDKVIQKAYEVGYKEIFISEKPVHLKSTCLSRVAIKANWSLDRFKILLKRKTPVVEIFANFLKKILKTIFRESGYNWIRSILIRIYK